MGFIAVKKGTIVGCIFKSIRWHLFDNRLSTSLVFCLWSRCCLLILFIVVVLLVTLDAKYSENEYFHNPSLTSFATFFTQVFFPGVFLIPIAKPVFTLIMSNSNSNDGGDGGNNGSDCNCNNYDDKEKAATPTVKLTAMAMAAALATEGNSRCNFSQLQWWMRLWQ